MAESRPPSRNVEKSAAGGCAAAPCRTSSATAGRGTPRLSAGTFVPLSFGRTARAGGFPLSPSSCPRLTTVRQVSNAATRVHTVSFLHWHPLGQDMDKQPRSPAAAVALLDVELHCPWGECAVTEVRVRVEPPEPNWLQPSFFSGEWRCPLCRKRATVRWVQAVAPTNCGVFERSAPDVGFAGASATKVGRA